MYRISLAALSLLAVTADSGRAQRYGPVMEGEKIRVRYCAEVKHDGSLATRCDRAEGRVQRVAGDTLVINRESGGGSVATRLAWVTELEVSHGYRFLVLTSAAAAAAGMAGGLAVRDSWGGRAQCEDDPGGCALLTIVAAEAGAVVGLILSGEKWEEVPLDQLRVSVVAQRDSE
jgi:hypothetical protein